MIGHREMHTGRRVIIGYDGSSGGKDALALGRQLCQALNAIPVIAYCVSFPKYLIDPLELGLALDEVARPVVDEARFEINIEGAETRRLLDKSPARALQALAEEIQPAAIVIGSAHSRIVGRITTGSVGRRLLNGSPCPVAVAPHGYADLRPRDFASISIALDEGVESERALNVAAEMARHTHARLEIVGVMEPISYGSIPRAALADLGLIQSRYTAQMLEDAAVRVEGGIEVSIERREGDPGPTLAEYSRGFDLMVIGSRGFGPIRRVLLGSVSTYLMDHAHCPVMITPRGASREGQEADMVGADGSFAG